jgi:pyoverdine/dityrosine biosynthesis protein Dit1
MTQEPFKPANDANFGKLWMVGQDDTLDVWHFVTLWLPCHFDQRGEILLVLEFLKIPQLRWR